jgi:hypothetical protein
MRGGSAIAQTPSQWAPAQAHPGDLINVFVDWPGGEPADGVIVESGDDLEIVAVEAVGTLRKTQRPLTLRRSVDGVLAESDHRLVGPHRFVVTLRSAPSALAGTVSIVPFERVVDRTGERLERHPRHEMELTVDLEAKSLATGRALNVSAARTGPFRVQSRSIDLNDSPGLTVSFWLKTVDREKVILSTWRGNDHVDYPFEFVVGIMGEIRVFSGWGGMHYSLGSTLPVADGSWRHVAFVVEFESGDALLAVDGVVVDRRILRDLRGIRIDDIFVGGREGGESVFEGFLDELLILPTAKSEEELGGMARIPARAVESTTGSLVLDFESNRFRSLLSGTPDGQILAPSHLTLHQPVTDVVAQFRPGSVLLKWVLEYPEPQAIVIERSNDGFRFKPVHRVELRDLDLESFGMELAQSHEDFVTEDTPVYFYRIEQQFGDGSVIRSHMIKIGRGATETPTSIELMGNSPNPFSNSTEVVLRIEEPTPLRLSVWSVSGHFVETLASETRDAGVHRIPFEAGNLPSGTYFLRLETEHGVQTHKMIVRQ